MKTTTIAFPVPNMGISNDRRHEIIITCSLLHLSSQSHHLNYLLLAVTTLSNESKSNLHHLLADSVIYKYMIKVGIGWWWFPTQYNKNVGILTNMGHNMFVIMTFIIIYCTTIIIIIIDGQMCDYCYTHTFSHIPLHCYSCWRSPNRISETMCQCGIDSPRWMTIILVSLYLAQCQFRINAGATKGDLFVQWPFNRPHWAVPAVNYPPCRVNFKPLPW